MLWKDIEKLKSVEVIRPADFVMAGNSEFSIWNTNSGNKFDYKIRRVEGSANHFVKVYINGEWVYAGFLTRRGTKIEYIQGKKGKLSIDSPPIKGILYALRFNDGPLPMPMCMTHHGKCGRCGRKLKDAESVSRGFGPDCWQMVLGSRSAAGMW